MTTSNKSDLPVYDFSTTPEQRAAEQAKQDAAIAAAQVAALEKSINDAPAVKTIKSKASGLVPAKKPAAKKSGKAGRVVGISADENAFLKKALQLIANSDAMLQTFVESGKFEEAFDKLQARYNK